MTTLGILLNNDGNNNPIYTTFDGETVDTSSILVRYTLTGDLNLDQQINADDYALIDSGYAAHASAYQFGDINLDGAINADDYFLIDRAFSNQGAILSALQASPIPEPSVIVLAGLALLLFVPRAPRP